MSSSKRSCLYLILSLVGWYGAAGPANAADANSSDLFVDFRNQPAHFVTSICLPDDPYKTSQSGRVVLTHEQWMTQDQYPQQELSRHIAVDLIMSDGSTLSASSAVDQFGYSMDPHTARGTVGQWNQVRCNFGKWLSGRTIRTVLVDYNDPIDTGRFQAWLDDIVITDGSLVAGDLNCDGTVDMNDLGVPSRMLKERTQH